MSDRAYRWMCGVLTVASMVLSLMTTQKLVEKRSELVAAQKQEDEAKEMASSSLRLLDIAFKQIDELLTNTVSLEQSAMLCHNQLMECASNQLSMLRYIERHKHE